jgi:hypothetical protein
VIRAIDELAGELLEAGQKSIKDKPGTAVKRTVQTKDDKKVEVDATQFDLREHAAIGAGMAAVREKGRHELIVGNIAGEAQPLTAGHSPEQKFMPHPYPWVKGVGSGGVSGPKGKNYDILAGRLQGQPTGQWMTLLAQNKPLPPEAAAHKADIEELFALTIAKEPSHNQFGQKRDLVYTLMSIDTMTGEGAKSAKEVFGKEGSHPSAFAKAQKGAKAVTAQLAGTKGSDPLGPEGKAAMDKRLDREKRTIVDWFKKNEGQLKAKTPKPTIKDVKDFIRAKLAALVGSRAR